ncbi:MAG TPA: hypothetical protein VHE34_09450 [Puia sp.]|uniref:hypothetical protein n=1 Tax=Puia sp. TaxID=2045100 RepID=UPI002BBDBE66|nr:hypothetical protein [Puia sp.]HVU95439.1 hypothetical protein [Puia sp.]
MALYFIILVVISFIVILLAIRTPLLRDAITNKAEFTAKAIERRLEKPKAPFSLARAQLAFWTVIISSSFAYLWYKFHYQIPGFANVNLILLGISVGATASAKLIDDSQKENGNLSQDNPSEGFLKDILSDKSGVSIHRLQNVLWTVIVGIIYIQFVAAGSGELPDESVLTENMLILMGISTGTYVGVKTMENSKSQPGA